MLTLKGDVSLVDPEQLTLHAEHVELLHAEREVARITAVGLTTVGLKTTGAFAEPVLRCMGTLELDPRAGLIVADGPVRLADAEATISGQAAQLTYHDNQLDQVHVTGHVRLISTRIGGRPAYALAERIALFPEQQMLTLTSTPPSRVLFWQERDQMCLTATELHIRRDPVTHEDAIQGYGDVHFSFDPAERDAIAQLLSQHIP